MRKRLIVSAVLGLTAILGDSLGARQTNHLAAAICDNLTHAVIGLLTWIGVGIDRQFYSSTSLYIDSVLCFLLSSFIDIDHFICAKSLSLKEARSLNFRPFLHCTSIPVILLLTVIVLSRFVILPWVSRISWILLAAVASHHIRDSTRRGLWLWPFGATPPLPYSLYIFLEMLLPWIINSVIDYKIHVPHAGNVMLV